MTQGPEGRRRGGFTVLELLVALAIVGIALATGITTLRSSLYSLSTASETLESNLRLARSFAIRGGTHYRLRVTATSEYRVERLREEAGEWVLDRNVRTIALPPHVEFNVTGTIVRFDARGMMAEPSDPDSLVLEDRRTGEMAPIRVWKSGQIHRA